MLISRFQSLAGAAFPIVTGAPELAFNFDFDLSALGQEFCIILDDMDTVFAGPGSETLSTIFDGNNCIILTQPACPSAGTGDANLDSIVNIQVGIGYRERLSLID